MNMQPKLKAVYIALVLSIVFVLTLIITPTTLSKKLDQVPNQLPTPSWQVHIYANPSDNGYGLEVAIDTDPEDCNLNDMFNATLENGQAPFNGDYQPLNKRYFGSFPGFFKPNKSAQQADLYATCKSNQGGEKTTNKIPICWYDVPITIGAAGFPIKSCDNGAELRIFNDSLSKHLYLISMYTNALPAPPKPWVKFIKVNSQDQAYSFRASGSELTSSQNMLLTIRYSPDTVANIDYNKLDLYRWSAGNWVTMTNTTRFPPDSGDPRISVTTKHFGTYVLGYSVKTVYLPIITR